MKAIAFALLVVLPALSHAQETETRMTEGLEQLTPERLKMAKSVMYEGFLMAELENEIQLFARGGDPKAVIDKAKYKDAARLILDSKIHKPHATLSESEMPFHVILEALSQAYVDGGMPKEQAWNESYDLASRVANVYLDK